MNKNLLLILATLVLSLMPTTLLYTDTRTLDFHFSDKNFQNIVISSTDFDIPVIFTIPQQTCATEKKPWANLHGHGWHDITTCSDNPHQIVTLSSTPTNFIMTLADGSIPLWIKTGWAYYKKDFPVYVFGGKNNSIIVHYLIAYNNIKPTGVEIAANTDLEFYDA